MLFETVIDLGLKEITTREVARNRPAARALVAQTFGLKLALGYRVMAGEFFRAIVSRYERIEGNEGP